MIFQGGGGVWTPCPSLWIRPCSEWAIIAVVSYDELYCLLLFPLCLSFFGSVLVLQISSFSVISSFAIILPKKRESMSLPSGAVV